MHRGQVHASWPAPQFESGTKLGHPNGFGIATILVVNIPTTASTTPPSGSLESFSGSLQSFLKCPGFPQLKQVFLSRFFLDPI
jgi:hypothetical protein